MNSRRFAVSTASVLLVLGLTSCGDEKKGRKPLLRDGGGSATADDDDMDDEESGDGLHGPDGGRDERGEHAGGPIIELLDAGPRCDVTHPQFGCGVTKGEWVTFDKGLRVDRRTGFAWYDVPLGKDASGRPETDDALEQKCKALQVPGVSGFRIPEMKDVRTLAAGCAKTLPTGPCKIESGRHAADQGADCACTGGPAQGPHASGGFCRPELSECETIWTATFCGSHSEGCIGDADHKHWFYDVTTGTIVVSGYDTEIAKNAKGRCVSTAQIELP